ncbi:hypothetical protein DFH06DRAFT_1130718 [Mycena polygramma]|nr:hypothetical protein DFH06DRAFT_1130718 [Mycena polygramma]
MHESLSLSNLSKLPLSLRAAANLAANGSNRHLAELIMRIPQMTVDHAALMLPLVFVHADPANIHTPDEFDTILGTPNRHHELRRISGATFALNALARLLDMRIVPPAAYVDLWPRVYPWIVFVHAYRDIIPARFIGYGPKQAYSVYSTIFLQIGHHPPTATLVSRSPVVRSILAHWWGMIVRNNGAIIHEAPAWQPDGWYEMSDILSYLTALDIEDDANFREVVDGVGGLPELAFLLMKHTAIALARPPCLVRTASLTIAVKFIHSRYDGDGPFSTAVLSQGVIGALVRALPLVDAWEDGGPMMALAGFQTLCQYLCHSPSEPVIQGLQGGLLATIIALGKTTAESPAVNGEIDNCYMLLQELLKHNLPRALMYYRAARQMKISFPTARSLASAPEFVSSAIFESWKNFEEYVDQRLAALDYFESGNWISEKACENLQASIFSAKSEFKKCSGCSVTYYCSKACQRVDWRDGHQALCNFETRADETQNLTARETAFIRAFMEYNSRSPLFLREQAWLLQVQFMYTRPGVAFFTLFDYTRVPTPGWFSVLPTAQLLRAPDASLRLAQLSARGDRLQLYAVLVQGRHRPWMKLFPVWSSSSKLHDALVKIVNDLPPGRPYMQVHLEVVLKIRGLGKQLDEDENFREVY